MAEGNEMVILKSLMNCWRNRPIRSKCRDTSRKGVGFVFFERGLLNSSLFGVLGKINWQDGVEYLGEEKWSLSLNIMMSVIDVK